MPAKGPGGGTSFEDMSHEQMLAWLDRANAGTVQAAADRLVTAAKEIRKIAEELKVRPQWVEWKGEGADAFRTWSADLANSTLRLGDFSEDAAKWLGQASGAIAQAQASIPRDAGSAQANLDAARATRNDPDAAAVAAKSESELAALAAHKEEVRQQAAAQMRKLGETYSLSATQMNALERPKFPPPPEAIAPGRSEDVNDRQVLARPGDANQGAVATSSGAVSAAQAGAVGTSESGSSSPDVAPRQRPAGLDITAPTEIHMDVDSVDTLPEVTRNPAGPVGAPPGPARPEGGGPSPTGLLPPALGGAKGPVLPTGPGPVGRAVATGRTPLLPGTGPAGPPTGRGPGVPGVPGGGQGIVGGRPATPSAGRSTGALPRGLVVGGGSPASLGPVGPSTASGRPVGHASGPQAQTSGRRTSSPSSGVVGGSPQQQAGRAGAGSTGPVGSGTAGRVGAARGGIAGGVPSGTRTGDGRNGVAPPRSTPGSSRTDNRNGQHRLATEDEETWRQSDGRRIVPPVVD
ncbi:translation initiation factor IF-2 [Streptomyces sp. KR55]|uniref:translation initiation factor IF-2 n=1 Tax=Streptomyces sp. KR55 TaxID=3457425 RepID=UPI003FD1B9FB